MCNFAKKQPHPWRIRLILSGTKKRDAVGGVLYKIIYLLFVAVVENVSALGTELRRILRVLGLPAAFVAAVKGRFCGLGSSALGTEFALVYRTAFACPAVCGSGLSAVNAEFSAVVYASA